MAARLGKHIWLLAGVLALATGLTLANPGSASADKRTVLELFTSQGCSSCPPADVLLKEFSADDSVLALSFAVDYWDYLGWKDTLASRANTERQYSYAAQRGDRSVYTPQIIINGREHAVGNDSRAIKRSIDRQQKDHGGTMGVEVDLTVSGDAITVGLGSARDGVRSRSAKVWLVLYAKKRVVKIARGENRGKTITYTNVVRDMVALGDWTGEAARMSLSHKSIKASKRDYDHCVVIVQHDDRGRPGEIIGASDAERMNGS